MPSIARGGDMKQLLTVKEIATSLQCSTFQVYRLVGRNLIPHLRIAGSAIRFDPDAIAVWLEKQSYGL